MYTYSKCQAKLPCPLINVHLLINLQSGEVSPLPPNHPDLSFGISREWYSAKQIGGEQSEAIHGIISKKRKAPHDDAEEAHIRQSRQPTAQSISDDESSD